jgi:BASS family bile acid:Na+ symporter
MLLSASPGGATANLFSHLAKGDVALNITLTAVNSLLSLFTLPLIVELLAGGLPRRGEGHSPPDRQGAPGLRHRARAGRHRHGAAREEPSLSDRLEKPVKIASAVFLLLVIGAAVAKERAHLGEYFRDVGLPALVFNLVSLGAGYLVPRFLGLPKRQATAIGMEIGIHNGTLAIAVASSPLLLNNPVMAIPPAIYSLIMFFTAGAFAAFMAKRTEAPEPEPKVAPVA